MYILCIYICVCVCVCVYICMYIYLNHCAVHLKLTQHWNQKPAGGACHLQLPRYPAPFHSFPGHCLPLVGIGVLTPVLLLQRVTGVTKWCRVLGQYKAEKGHLQLGTQKRDCKGKAFG